MEIPSWASALIGAVVGGLISFLTQFLIFNYNQKKESRRILVRSTAILTGRLDNLMNAVFRTMEASVWCSYAVGSKKNNLVPIIDIPTLLKAEKEALIEFDRLRGEIEIGLTEYWGNGGNADQKFSELIAHYRKCTLPAEESKLTFKNETEVQDFHVASYVSKLREELEARDDSYFTVCKKIVFHLRCQIAPIN